MNKRSSEAKKWCLVQTITQCINVCTMSCPTNILEWSCGMLAKQSNLLGSCQVWADDALIRNTWINVEYHLHHIQRRKQLLLHRGRFPFYLYQLIEQNNLLFCLTFVPFNIISLERSTAQEIKPPKAVRHGDSRLQEELANFILADVVSRKGAFSIARSKSSSHNMSQSSSLDCCNFK